MSENESEPAGTDPSKRRSEALEVGAGLAAIAAAMGAIEGILASGNAFGGRQQQAMGEFQSLKGNVIQECQSAAATAQSDLTGLQDQLAAARAELATATATKRRSANAAAATESLERARAGIPAAAAELPAAPSMVDPDLAQRMRRLILSELHPAPMVLSADSKAEIRQVEDWAGSNWEGSIADQPTATVAVVPASPTQGADHPHTSFDSWFESTGHTPSRVPPAAPSDDGAEGSDSIDQFQKQWQAWRKRVEGPGPSS